MGSSILGRQGKGGPQRGEGDPKREPLMDSEEQKSDATDPVADEDKLDKMRAVADKAEIQFKGFLVSDFIIAGGILQQCLSLMKDDPETALQWVVIALMGFLVIDIVFAVLMLQSIKKSRSRQARRTPDGSSLYPDTEDSTSIETGWAPCLARINAITNPITVFLWIVVAFTSQGTPNRPVCVVVMVAVIRVGKLVPLYFFDQALRSPAARAKYLGEEPNTCMTIARCTMVTSIVGLVIYASLMKCHVVHSNAGAGDPLEMAEDDDDTCQTPFGFGVGIFVGGTASFGSSFLLSCLFQNNLSDQKMSDAWMANMILCWLIAVVQAVQGPCKQAFINALHGGLTVVGIICVLIAISM